MFYKLEWNEENTNHFQRVFMAKDLSTLWKAIRYMNWQRKDNRQPTMEKVQITVLEKYRGEYSVITGAYIKDLLLDLED